jgi:hypothetical protein
MKRYLYSVFDIKIETYGSLITLDNDEVAKREITTVVNKDDKTNWQLYPQDYRLMKVAEIDDSKGIPVPYEQPIHVVDFHSVKIEE